MRDAIGVGLNVHRCMVAGVALYKTGMPDGARSNIGDVNRSKQQVLASSAISSGRAVHLKWLTRSRTLAVEAAGPLLNSMWWFSGR
jgi:hypothetical protein